LGCEGKGRKENGQGEEWRGMKETVRERRGREGRGGDGWQGRGRAPETTYSR